MINRGLIGKAWSIINRALTINGDVTLGAAKHLVLPLHNDSNTPTLAFGDGNSGLYEYEDNKLRFTIDGTPGLRIISTGIDFFSTDNPKMIKEATTATNPTFAPNYGDTDTGIGCAAADKLSLIAGAIEAIRLTETTAKMVEKFACSALGGVGRVAFSATANITANHTITIQVNIPDGAKILGVQMRVDTALAATETWNAQYVTGATQAIATNQAVAQNTKVNAFFDENAATAISSGETDITITKNSNPGVDVFTAQGTIRAVVYYEDWTALASL